MDHISLLKHAAEQLWLPEKQITAEEALARAGFCMSDIEEAEERLVRFAPLISALFPETEAAGGIIESPLTAVPLMGEALGLSGRLFIKRDSDLPIAGSVKARGGIYEVLKHTEDVLKECGREDLLDLDRVTDMDRHIEKIRSVLGSRKVQVGSTGNLGLSIGIMSAALGYEATVHMSADAKDWKKALLREKGVKVIEYEGDYSAAVARGRAASDADPMSYFVDDENSADLFMGYAVAALRLKKQLEAQNVAVDDGHPLCVYLPCGVGGAPGGVCFGLKTVFGDAVRCYFAEPVQAPCMLAAFLMGGPVPVTDIGLTGRTQADGLAVGTASRLVYDTVKELVSGEYTIDDEKLSYYQNLLYNKEKIFIEPSSAAALGFAAHACYGVPDLPNVTHVAWATGGRLVPEAERQKQLCHHNIIEVAAALIRDGERFLICRRPPYKARGGLWEFVGGKLEPHETGRQALERECREELDVSVEAGSLFTDVLHVYPDLTVHLSLYNARITKGEPKLIEHTESRWILPSEICEYDFCPADEQILKRIALERSEA